MSTAAEPTISCLSVAYQLLVGPNELLMMLASSSYTRHTSLKAVLTKHESSVQVHVECVHVLCLGRQFIPAIWAVTQQTAICTLCISKIVCHRFSMSQEISLEKAEQHQVCLYPVQAHSSHSTDTDTI